jgi:hypothetical protein
MADTFHATKAIALGRPRGAHRFGAFSPKLARRVMFYRRALLELWLLLEANPKVITFCERPGYVLVDETVISPTSGYATLIAKSWSY